MNQWINQWLVSNDEDIDSEVRNSTRFCERPKTVHWVRRGCHTPAGAVRHGSSSVHWVRRGCHTPAGEVRHGSSSVCGRHPGIPALPTSQCSTDDVSSWCASKSWQLNCNKTELLLFGTAGSIRKIPLGSDHCNAVLACLPAAIHHHRCS